MTTRADLAARIEALTDAAQQGYDLIMLLAFAKPDADIGVPKTFTVLGALREALAAIREEAERE